MDANPFRTRPGAGILVIIVLAGLCLRLANFVGYGLGDDQTYLQIVNDIVEGHFILKPDWAYYRILVTYPIAAFFTLLGASELSMVLPTLLSSLGMIVLAYFFARRLYGETAGVYAATLLAFYPLNASNAGVLINDIPLALAQGLCVYLFLLADEEPDADAAKRRFIISGLCLSAGYLVKASAAFLVPALALYSIVIWKGWRRRSYFLVVPLLTYFAEGVLSLLYNGSFFFHQQLLSRFYVNLAGHGAPRHLGTALAYYPLEMFCLGARPFREYGLYFYFAVPAFALMLALRFKKTLPLFLWAAVLFGYHEFGSASFGRYIPIHRLYRFLECITIPCMICLGALLAYPKSFRMRALSLAVLAALCLHAIPQIEVKNGNCRKDMMDVKQAYEFVRAMPPRPVYGDSQLIAALRLYSGNENPGYWRILQHNSPPETGSYVILGGRRLIDNSDWYLDALQPMVQPYRSRLRLVKTVKGDINAMRRQDGQIYVMEKEPSLQHPAPAEASLK